MLKIKFLGLKFLLIKLLYARNLAKKPKISSRFFSTLEKNVRIFESGSNHDWKGLKMVDHSIQSDDYSWYLILREKKTKTYPNPKFLAIFNGRNN